MSDQEARDERVTLISAAVRAIVPNVTNETAAWNVWNNLARNEDFCRAIVELHAGDHGYRKHPEPEMEFMGEDAVYRSFTDDPDVAARWRERGDVVRKRTKAVPAGPWVWVGGEQS